MTNHERTLEDARQRFLTFDQSAMLARLPLDYDEEYIYLAFFSEPYRLSRATGKAERMGETAAPAAFSDTMTFYDLLCHAKPHCAASGQFAPINSVARTFHSANLGGSVFDSCAPVFAQNPDKLARACEALGGVPAGKGDVAYELNVFPNLPLRLQFWQADEDFPASLQLLWDMNTLDFMHYETTYYAASHLYHRLKELMARL